MSYWFASAEQLRAGRVSLSGADAHHLARVQRARVGDEITVADGEGQACRVRLTAITGHEVIGEVLEMLPPAPAPPVHITLYQAVCKGERMAWLIQKTTELGLQHLVPLLTERTVVLLPVDRAGSRWERWQMIARAAAQQAQRPRLPQIGRPVSLLQSLADLPHHDLALVLHAGEPLPSFRRVLQAHREAWPSLPGTPRVALWVGPEGGFSPAELASLVAAGGQAVSLGPGILRTETAGMIAVALVMYEWGGYDLFPELPSMDGGAGEKNGAHGAGLAVRQDRPPGDPGPSMRL